MRYHVRSEIQDEQVFQRIVYSQCWEDPEIAADGLELGEQDDLLCLTSAGCNVLALALRRPRSIIALDFSAAQNALLELKIAALHRLSWSEYAAFLGARPARDRLATYRQRLRPELRDEVRAYFDRCTGELQRGIIHTGRFQRYLQIFRRGVLPLVHRRKAIDALMHTDGREARQAFYDHVWDNRRWRALFTVFFGRAVMARLGRDPAFFQFVEQRNIGAEFLERAKRALIDTPLADNHFLQYALLGAYPDLERGPLYLRESNFEALRARTDTIRIVRSDLESELSRLDESSLSALYLSDLFEWVSEQHHEQMLRAIVRVARPGARMVYWNLLVPRSRPQRLADVIDVDTALARELHARDKAFVYGSFHVESVKS